MVKEKVPPLRVRINGEKNFEIKDVALGALI
jgi:hypothetical protein